MKSLFKFFSYVLACLLLSAVSLLAQDPLQFKKEVDSLTVLNQTFKKKNVIVFTGSSSIRLWANLKTSFPEHNVLNLGFGGSEMSDLLYYTINLYSPIIPNKFLYMRVITISSGDELPNKF